MQQNKNNRGSALVLAIGLLLFTRADRTFMDTI